MNKELYIKLPKIKSLSVSDYNLFERDWQIDFDEGLNILLGANSMGKTTTLYMIAYAIVGDYEGIDTTFFKDRKNEINISNVEKKEPIVNIVFEVNNTTIAISRRIDKNEIIKLRVGENEYISEDNTLNRQYEILMKEITNIEELEDLAFLLSKFLIREEEGNYLLWEQVNQSRIIRYLINYAGFQKEFANLEDVLQKTDSKYKREADFVSKMRKRKEELEKDRDKEREQAKKQTNETYIVKQHDVLKKEKEKFVKENDELYSVTSKLNKDIIKYTEELTNINTELENLNEELSNLESKFYEDTFSIDKINLSLHKNNNLNLCIYCNNKISDEQVNKIKNDVQIKHQCPVCDSKLKSKVNTYTEKADDIDVKQIDYLRNKIQNLKNETEIITDNINTKTKSLEDLRGKYNDNNDVIYNLTLEILDLESQLEEISHNDGIHITEFDLVIKRLERDIKEYEEKVKPLLDNFNRAKKRLEKKNNELNKTINVFTEKLNLIFKKYTKSYFINDCELIPVNWKNPKGLEIPLTYFVPKFDGKDRLFQSRVSKSEAIFLEYLFRLSLLEMYTNLTGYTSFLALETSEGSFDVANTSEIADTFSEIGNLKFPIFIITNISKVDFILEVLPDKKERQKRIINFLQYGRLSLKQKENEHKYIEALQLLSIN